MAKIIFSLSVTKKLDIVQSETIRKSIYGSAEMKKEINRVLQQANRRAQNIEKSGLTSPAYQALVLEGRKGYTKFSIGGTDITSEYDWQKAKYEYSKAIEYLQNPTSSATGARQYVKHIAEKYNVPLDVASNAIKMSTETQFVGGQIPLMNYRAMIDEHLTESNAEKNSMEQNANIFASELEQNVTNASKKIKKQIDKQAENILKSLADGLKLK